MVSYAYVQDRAYYGFSQAAKRIGQLFAIYRSPDGLNPIRQENYVQDIYMSANVSWDYMKANSYGNAVWQLIIDGRKTQAFDYLVGNGKTFFIDAQQPLLPINGVDCNRVVTLTRPNGTPSPGANPYGGYDPTNVITVLSECPVSILDKGRPSAGQFKLPLDVGAPRFLILFPALPGVEPRIGDLMDDERGVRIGIYSVEKTDLGYRCTGISEQV